MSNPHTLCEDLRYHLDVIVISVFGAHTPMAICFSCDVCKHSLLMPQDPLVIRLSGSTPTTYCSACVPTTIQHPVCCACFHPFVYSTDFSATVHFVKLNFVSEKLACSQRCHERLMMEAREAEGVDARPYCTVCQQLYDTSRCPRCGKL